MTLMEKIHRRLRPYAKERGLQRKGRSYYTITEDTAYCVSFENHTHDVYAHFYLMPLYMREENHILTYGERLNTLFRKKMPSLEKTASEEEIDAWVAIVTGIIDSYVLPFFRQVGSPEKLLNFLALSWDVQKSYFSCPPHQRLRLKSYTLLYLRRRTEARGAIEAYRAELGQCGFLMDRIIKSCHEEVDELESMLRWTDEKLDAFFTEAAAFTKSACF